MKNRNLYIFRRTDIPKNFILGQLAIWLPGRLLSMSLSLLYPALQLSASLSFSLPASPPERAGGQPRRSVSLLPHKLGCSSLSGRELGSYHFDFPNGKSNFFFKIEIFPQKNLALQKEHHPLDNHSDKKFPNQLY